jgi:hypothetical protein
MKAKPSKTTSPQRGRGRPRNDALDALQRDLAVSRRRASTLLREQGSEKSGDLAPVASARLHKLRLESERLTQQIRALKIEAALLEKRLLTSDDACRLFGPSHEIVKARLSSCAKTLAPRLFNQPQKAIEQCLADWSDSVLAAALAASERAVETLKPTPIHEVL